MTHALRETTAAGKRRTRAPGVVLLAAMVLAAPSAGCGTRTLVAVEPCPASGGAAVASCPAAQRGLVGHWRFDDGAGNMTAHDSSENGNDATLATTLDASAAWVAGRVGSYALAIDAVGYASVPRSPTIDTIVHEVTVAGWMYLDGPIADYATIASRQRGNTLFQYYHIAVNAQARPSLFINTTVPANMNVQPLGDASSDPVALQTWTHIAGTYDGATARLYRNGDLVASKAITGDFGVDITPVILGANRNGSMITERFPGLIDEIVLYNRALSQPEIALLAAGTSF